MKTLSPARALRKARDQLLLFRVARHVHAEESASLVRLGTDYGGYSIPAELPEADWICYSGGIGDDASFELELIARYGCEVVAFDPTPRSIEYMQRIAAETPKLSFLPIGLWSEDTQLPFYAPRNPDHISHSIGNLQRTDDHFVAHCRSVPSLMADLGHERVDILKLDVEGAEYEVLPPVLDGGYRLKILIVEFHWAGSLAQMTTMIDRVRIAGYKPVHLEDMDVTFVDADLV